MSDKQNVITGHHKPSSVLRSDYGKVQQMPYKNKVINCIKEDNSLIKKKLKTVTVEEGMKIATRLFEILATRKDGIGLAANQVGIDAAVAVVNVREPLILINPEIVSREVELPYYEGCLSYPGKGVHTKRYRDIIVSTSQEESNWYFSGTPSVVDNAKGSWEDTPKDKQKETNLKILETVCVQHEIDHLNGKTIHDRKKETTVRVEKKIGRNDLVTIKKDKAVKVMKYKKVQSLLNSGWVLT